MPRFSTFDIWFRPKGFESERLYERLGAPLIKRYVPTGGDLLKRRKLLSASLKNPTATPIYRVERPWARRKQG